MIFHWKKFDFLLFSLLITRFWYFSFPPLPLLVVGTTVHLATGLAWVPQDVYFVIDVIKFKRLPAHFVDELGGNGEKISQGIKPTKKKTFFFSFGLGNQRIEDESSIGIFSSYSFCTSYSMNEWIVTWPEGQRLVVAPVTWLLLRPIVGRTLKFFCEFEGKSKWMKKKERMWTELISVTVNGGLGERSAHSFSGNNGGSRPESG